MDDLGKERKSKGRWDFEKRKRKIDLFPFIQLWISITYQANPQVFYKIRNSFVYIMKILLIYSSSMIIKLF